ncbi:MAG: hypothetical protein JST78_09670 [Bacteroidetes bacterium]|nr:hypothetical protein [Bacteroidota bacterium]
MNIPKKLENEWLQLNKAILKSLNLQIGGARQKENDNSILCNGFEVTVYFVNAKYLEATVVKKDIEFVRVRHQYNDLTILIIWTIIRYAKL